MHSGFGKIAHLTQTGGVAVSPLRQEIARPSRLIANLAVTIGLGFFAVGWPIGVPFWEDFVFAIGIIVSMVPEGLLPTLTLALVLATQRMAKRKVLIRHLPAVEALGSTTVICTDKTGHADPEPHDGQADLPRTDDAFGAGDRTRCGAGAQLRTLLPHRRLVP